MQARKKKVAGKIGSFPGGSVVKNLPVNAGDAGSIPGSGRSPGEGNGNPRQCSGRGNPMDREAWWAAVSPWGHDEWNMTEPTDTGFPRGSDSEESAGQCRRCRFDPWVGKIPWRRKWLPTPVFLPGESHGQRSPAGCSQSTGSRGVRHA